MPPLTGGRPLTDLGTLFDDPSARVGQPVELSGVEVDRVESGGAFWVKDGNARVQVAAPGDTEAIEAGDRVDLRGTVERDGSGGVRIRASGMQVR
jgi:hypothetical protein